MATEKAAAPRRAASIPASLLLPLTFVLLTVAVRVWLAHRIDFCGTPDSCTYYSLALSLGQHHGFVQNFLYQYAMVPHGLPQHGVEYWRPGTSFILLLAQLFGGVTLFRSLLITIAAGLLLAAAAWRAVRNAAGDKQTAALAFALCLVLPDLWRYSTSPDASIFYGCAVAWLLVLFRVDFHSHLEDLFAWFALVAVNLIRNDAILLLPAVIGVLALRRRRPEQRGASWTYIAFVLAAFFAAMLPMELVTRAALGHSSQTHISQALYLLNPSDLIAYNKPLSAHTALAAGWHALLRVHVVATATIVYHWIVVLTGVGAILLAGLLPAFRKHLREPLPEWQGGALFAATLLVAYGLVLPAIGTVSAHRSFAGLTALLAALMATGAFALLRNRHAALLLGWSVALFYLVSGAIQTSVAVDDMRDEARRLHAIAQFIATHANTPPAETLVMTADPAQFSVTTSYPAVPIPSNGLVHVAEAVHDLRPRFVLVNTEPGNPGAYEAGMIATLRPLRTDLVAGTDVLVLTLPDRAQ